MIYLGYLLLLMLLLKQERQQASSKNIFRSLIPALYILFVGLRGANVGVDTPVYYDHYYTFGQWGCDFVEVGFDWLNRFIFHQGFSHAPFFIACSALCIIPVSIAVNNRLERSEYSIFMLLFCTVTFVSLCNGMRQNIACGILFLLLLWYDDSDFKFIYKLCIYIGSVIFASLFHASVLLLTPIILLKYLRLSDKIYLLLYLFSFVFIFLNVSSFIPEIQIGSRDYGSYLGGSFANKSASSLGFIITTIRNILIFGLLISYGLFRKYTYLANLTFCMLVLTNVGFNIPLVGRLNMYIAFFYIFIVAKIIEKKGNQGSRNLTFMLILIILVITIYSFISPTNRLIPYDFYWDTPNYSIYLK